MRRLARYRHAYLAATKWSPSLCKSVSDIAQGYPIELRTSGTLQTLAFTMGKREAGHVTIASAIAEWVLSKESGAPLEAIDDGQRVPGKLLELMAKAPIERYLAGERETIAFADALKTVTKALARSRE